MSDEGLTSHVPPGWSLIRIHGEPQYFCAGCQLHINKNDWNPTMENPLTISPQLKEMIRKKHGLDLDFKS
jgi:hypothetical protein